MLLTIALIFIGIGTILGIIHAIFHGAEGGYRDLWPIGSYTPVSLLITIGFVLLIIGAILN